MTLTKRAPARYALRTISRATGACSSAIARTKTSCPCCTFAPTCTASRASFSVRSSTLAPKVGLPKLLVAEQRLGAVGEDDTARREHVAAVGDRERDVRVLLD